MTDDMRKAFEHWYSSEGESPRAIERKNDGYRLMQADQSWTAWQAAWGCALSTDEMRKVARHLAGEALYAANPDIYWTGSEIAKAAEGIRAALSKGMSREGFAPSTNSDELARESASSDEASRHG
jgi:dienelactone hydrolase